MEMLLSGPFTEGDLTRLLPLSRPEANLANMAFFESESINNRVPLSNLYPSRANITRSSFLNAHVEASKFSRQEIGPRKSNLFLKWKKN